MIQSSNKNVDVSIDSNNVTNAAAPGGYHPPHLPQIHPQNPLSVKEHNSVQEQNCHISNGSRRN